MEKLFSLNGPFHPMKSILCNLLKNFKDPHKVLPRGLPADLHNPLAPESLQVSQPLKTHMRPFCGGSLTTSST